jgi:exodeoxyribonuclease VII large subunit
MYVRNKRNVDRFTPETRMNASPDPFDSAPIRDVITVSQLNRAAAALLERSFPLIWVSGEVSNLTRAASGHWYFTLKDAQASVRAVMFRGRNQSVAFSPAHGDRVEVRVQVSLYEARGEFQLNVEAMRRAGTGDLYQQFLQLKTQLLAEGLFDEARKRPIPPHPRSVGVITSPKAAALRDVLTTLARRAPQVGVILYPAAVQGAQAPAELLAAVRTAGRRAECDVLLLVRGGGSIEDLWAFNDEALARAVAASPIPVISGVGHETDFTIADFAADWRAPTPTGAAMRAVPDRQEQLQTLARERHRLMQAWARQCGQIEQRLDLATRMLRAPSLQWSQRAARLDQWSQRLAQAGRRNQESAAAHLHAARARLRAPSLQAYASALDATRRALATATAARLESHARRLDLAGASLELVSPFAVLERGYALVTDANGAVVRHASALSPGDTVAVTLADGRFDAQVTGIDPTR